MEAGNFGDHQAIIGGKGLNERRLDYGSAYRIYYMTEGDVSVGNALLRDYINSTQAFATVSAELQIQEASLRRMVGPKGNALLKPCFAFSNSVMTVKA